MHRLTPLLVALVLAVPASGQALKDHNAKADVFFDADRIEVQDRADRAILSGNVRVRQAGLKLSAARLTVAYARAGGGGAGGVDVERLDATGGVVVTSSTETARGDIAIYDLTRRIITMLGDVTLVQRQNELRGGRLVIDLNTGRAVVDGRSVDGAPEGAIGTSGGGRVSGRFTVSTKDQGSDQ
jgi:lipopolysaccharide export system protein LptA